jgi:hypothetical protein
MHSQHSEPSNIALHRYTVLSLVILAVLFQADTVSFTRSRVL